MERVKAKHSRVKRTRVRRMKAKRRARTALPTHQTPQACAASGARAHSRDIHHTSTDVPCDTLALAYHATHARLRTLRPSHTTHYHVPRTHAYRALSHTTTFLSTSHTWHPMHMFARTCISPTGRCQHTPLSALHAIRTLAHVAWRHTDASTAFSACADSRALTWRPTLAPL
jgi:hypothetical protein